MILLVADTLDAQARWLAGRWSEHDARILTAADLSQPGWSFRSDSPRDWTGVAGGQLCNEDSPLTGLLNLLPEVTREQLPHIVCEDQCYVAHEMNAFLLSWETELACPILNRPTPNCLIGPNMSSEEWTLLAARLGHPIAPVTRSSRSESRNPRGDRLQDARVVTVIGNRALGEDDDLRFRARTLAHEANVDLAAFYFSPSPSAEFLAATLRPDLANDEAADAMLQFFGEQHPC